MLLAWHLQISGHLLEQWWGGSSPVHETGIGYDIYVSIAEMS